MPTIERTIAELDQWYAQIGRLENSKRGLLRAAFADDALRIRKWMDFEEQILHCRLGIRHAMELQERRPERFERHSVKLEEIHSNGSYEDSVFVMTKYPAAEETARAARLQYVVGFVSSEIRRLGYRPRLASDRSFHRWLWDNVELHLCACARGVAIVEDQYAPELNPNVAMEWGWMVGMGRDVLFLRESGFNHDRADWAGLLSHEFSWQDPRPGIAAALTAFLPRRSKEWTDG